MEVSIPNGGAAVLLPSDYISQGGWCRGDLTKPKGKITTDVGVHQKGNQTPEGYSFCINGAVTAAYQDGYMSQEQSLQYMKMLKKRLLVTNPWLAIIHPFGLALDWICEALTPAPQENRLIESTLTFVYNDYFCLSRKEAESHMRWVEDEMGLRSVPSPSQVDAVVDQPAAGVRNIVEPKREVLEVTDEATPSRDESLAVGV